MKIRFELNNKETTVLEKIINKYAHIDREYVTIKDEHINRKFGVAWVKRNDEKAELNIDFKPDFTIELMKFIDDLVKPVIAGCNSMKFMFDGVKDRFKKWTDDEEDVWRLIATKLAKKYKESCIIGLVKHQDWVQINDRTKKLDTSWSQYPIKSEKDLEECIKKAGEVRFVKVGHGDWDMEKSSISRVSKWISMIYGDTSYEGKHVAKETNE